MTWLGKALKQKASKKMSMGPNYRNYFQGSPIPQPTSPDNHLVPTLADWTAPSMTATEVIQRQQKAMQQMAQSMTRQAFLPGALVYIGAAGAMQIHEVQEPPPYQTPDWLTAMHTTIDTLHAKGV